jgi:hypothetical protein
LADGTQIYAQIGLSRHTTVTGRLLADRLKQRFPAYVEKLGVGNIVEAPQAGMPIRLMIGSSAIEVYAMPQPIPTDMIGIALATTRDWPEARAAFAGCHAHLGVVALQRKDGNDNAFLNAICVTLVCATLCDMTPAIGVLWPTGNRLSEARRFRDVAARMVNGEPAIDLWVQTLFTDGPRMMGQRTLCAMTTGLRPFVGRELELLPVARGQEALGKIIGSLLAFTARRGAGFEDGDSVDMGNGEAVCLRLESQGQRSGIPIFVARLAKLDAQGRLPAEAFGDRPLPPRTQSASADRAGSAGEPDTAKHGRFVAWIPLARPSAISSDLLIAAVKRRFPSFKGQIFAPGKDGPQDAAGDSHIIQIGGTTAAIMSIDAPLPAGELDVAFAGADLVWPEARATVAPHTAHIVVGNISGADDCLGAVRCAGELSLLTAALCDLAPALAVIWCSGSVITKPQDFQDGAARFLSGTPPVDSWIQLQLLKGTTEDGMPGVAMVTTGLATFVGRELEFLPAKLHPAVVIQRVIGTAGYLLMNGPVVEHGHTIGVSHDEAIRVRHRDRGRRTGGPIYELSLELLDESVAPRGVTNLQAVPRALQSDGPRLMPATAPADASAVQQATPPAPALAKPAPGIDASRVVRNLRRPTT